jgi:hypothetical protein
MAKVKTDSPARHADADGGSWYVANVLLERKADLRGDTHSQCPGTYGALHVKFAADAEPTCAAAAQREADAAVRELHQSKATWLETNEAALKITRLHEQLVEAERDAAAARDAADRADADLQAALEGEKPTASIEAGMSKNLAQADVLKRRALVLKKMLSQAKGEAVIALHVFLTAQQAALEADAVAMRERANDRLTEVLGEVFADMLASGLILQALTPRFHGVLRETLADRLAVLPAT